MDLEIQGLQVLSFSNNLFYGVIPTQLSELKVLWTTPDPSEAGSKEETLWGCFDALSTNGFTRSEKTNAMFYVQFQGPGTKFSTSTSLFF